MEEYKTRILIFGGTGSLGSELVRYFTEDGNYDITVFSRDGHKQQALGMKFPNVRFILGDIRNKEAVSDAVATQDVVINTAALKIVYQGEKNPIEFFEVNTLGALNVARSCWEEGVFSFLQISSDKNVNPINLYGKTKSLAEDIVIHYGFNALRYGNVVTSAGAFTRIWRKQIEEGNKISIRTPYPTRFVLGMDEAVALVADALSLIHLRGVFVPHSLKSVEIKEIAEAMGVLDWIEKPLIPGEKQHEVLISESENGERVSDLLVCVNKGFVGNIDQINFNSKYAPRMTGKEFLEKFPVA